MYIHIKLAKIHPTELPVLMAKVSSKLNPIVMLLLKSSL